MWMMELRTNTATADTRIGSHRAVNTVIGPPGSRGVNRSLRQGSDASWSAGSRGPQQPLRLRGGTLAPVGIHLCLVREHERCPSFAIRRIDVRAARNQQLDEVRPALPCRHMERRAVPGDVEVPVPRIL